MFRENLKVGRRRQKLLAKQAILKALQEPLERKNWCVPFFSQLCIIGFFFFLHSEIVWSMIKITSSYFFLLRVGTLAWNKRYIGGLSRALRSSDIFERKESISPMPWKMLLGSVMKRHRSSGWKNGTRPWTVFESSRRIVSWFTKGPWLSSCYTSLFRRIKIPSISPPCPTCGSSADVWPGLVPPRPGWPFLDTDSATMIVSLLGQPINPGCTLLIF